MLLGSWCVRMWMVHARCTSISSCLHIGSNYRAQDAALSRSNIPSIIPRHRCDVVTSDVTSRREGIPWRQFSREASSWRRRYAEEFPDVIKSSWRHGESRDVVTSDVTSSGRNPVTSRRRRSRFAATRQDGNPVTSVQPRRHRDVIVTLKNFLTSSSHRDVTENPVTSWRGDRVQRSGFFSY